MRQKRSRRDKQLQKSLESGVGDEDNICNMKTRARKRTQRATR